MSNNTAVDPLHTRRMGDSDITGTAFRVNHAIFVLRHGRPVTVSDGKLASSYVVIEHLNGDMLTRHRSGQIKLLISRERASVLGHDFTTDAVEVTLPGATPLEQLRKLAGIIDPTDVYHGPFECRADRSPQATAVLELARQAGRMPALLVCSEACVLDGAQPISADEVKVYAAVRGRLLERASQAQVQLEHAAETEFVVYRERFGDAQHVAVVVGTPDMEEPVNVRLHSACFTGDLFGSLRCDCGEQLAGAVEHMEANGGGVILYLDQEGRGIGLANKMRAYSMQAVGHDTIDADRHLGFGADGRDFTPALTILTDLGIEQIRLLTNNPAKISALDSNGIQVVEQVAVSGSINPHNLHYLQTKRDLGGHLPSVAEGGLRDH